MSVVFKSERDWLDDLHALKYETPFMLIDPAQVRINAMHLKGLLPQVEIYYAVKSNNDPNVLKAMVDLVDGFEVSSLGELRDVQALGVSGNRIICSNTVKASNHIEASYAAGVRHFAFDSLSEIEKLVVHAPHAHAYARVAMSDPDTVTPNAKCFGIEPTSVVAYMHKAAMMGLMPAGLAFHMGPRAVQPEAWVRAIRICGSLITQLQQDGITIETLNIGGGLPPVSEANKTSLRIIAQTISDAINRYVPNTVRIIAEPGKAISATSAVIASTVIGRKTSGKNQEWLFLDMGVFQGLVQPLMNPDWRYPVFTDNLIRNEHYKLFNIAGPTSDPHDTIGVGYELPSIKTGDRLYIASSGAYTLTYGNDYNGFSGPKVYCIADQ